MQNYLRMAIIAGLLITSYLLVLAYQKDTQQYAATQQATTAPSTVPAQTNDVPNAISAPQTGTTSGDVPTAVGAVAQVAPQQTAAASSVQTGSLITVTTDKYRTQIDLSGGDIVHLELLDHSVKSDGTQPFTILQKTPQHLFVAQSGLVGPNGPDAQPTGRPLYHASVTQFQTSDAQPVLNVPLTYTDAQGVVYTKTYQFKQGQYPIELSVDVNNRSASSWQGQLYAQLQRDDSEDPSKSEQGFMQMATYLGGAWGKPDHPYNKLAFKNFAKEPLNQSAQDSYIAVIQHYFVSAWVPQPNVPVIMRTINNAKTGSHIISVNTSDQIVAAGAQHQFKATLYVGPKVQDNLKPLAKGLEQTVDYGKLWPIAQPLFFGLKKIHQYVGNWGWAIVLLTIAVKLLLWPLAATSYRSMAKMRVIAPKLQALKEQFGDDRQRFAQEMMGLYRSEKVNPLAGCLPLLLQMPIFMALYFVFMESVELRHAPWIGWITDLSSMDKWFVLPLFMGVTMYVQQLLNPQPTDPLQAKMFKLMPIVFTVFMLFFPSGLVLYWCVNNMLTIAQQAYINRSVEKQSGIA